MQAFLFAAFPDVRILEYRGVNTAAPLDVSTSATGNSATSSSGSVTTTNATDLLIGANYIMTSTAGAGSGFTARMITSPDSDIAEDQVVKTVGSCGASAPLSSAGSWIMQMAAFKAAGSPTPTPTPKPTPTPVLSPTPTSTVSLAWNANTRTSNINSNAVGYQLHTGFSSGNYTQTTDLG